MGMKKPASLFPGIPCLVCGVDSGPIRLFLAIFFGGFFLASILVAAWAYFSGRFNDQDKSAFLAIEAEERGDKS